VIGVVPWLRFRTPARVMDKVCRKIRAVLTPNAHDDSVRVKILGLNHWLMVSLLPDDPKSEHIFQQAQQLKTTRDLQRRGRVR